jgi:hypothetical protein
LENPIKAQAKKQRLEEPAACNIGGIIGPKHHTNAIKDFTTGSTEKHRVSLCISPTDSKIAEKGRTDYRAALRFQPN